MLIYCIAQLIGCSLIFFNKAPAKNKFKIFRYQLKGYSRQFNLLGGDESSSTLKEYIGTVLNSTNNNIVAQDSYNCYSVLVESD